MEGVRSRAPGAVLRQLRFRLQPSVESKSHQSLGPVLGQ